MTSSAQGLTRRPSRRGDDHEGLRALYQAIADHDGGGPKNIPDDVLGADVVGESSVVQANWVWEADDGRIAACLEVSHEVDDAEMRAYGDIDIHPGFRTREVEDEVAGVFRESALALAGRPVAVRILVGAGLSWKAGLLERAGFRADRYLYGMQRSLLEPSDAPAVPDGYAVRPLAGGEVAAWCAAFEEAFAASYDSPRISEAERRTYMVRSDYLPEADLVAVTDGGEVAALAWAQRATVADGSKRGWVWYVATRPAHRGRGLARALLLRCLEVLRDDGVVGAMLAVDTDNATGALRLYEGAGFRTDTTTVIYLAHVA